MLLLHNSSDNRRHSSIHPLKLGWNSIELMASLSPNAGPVQRRVSMVGTVQQRRQSFLLPSGHSHIPDFSHIHHTTNIHTIPRLPLCIVHPPKPQLLHQSSESLIPTSTQNLNIPNAVPFTVVNMNPPTEPCVVIPPLNTQNIHIANDVVYNNQEHQPPIPVFLPQLKTVIGENHAQALGKMSLHLLLDEGDVDDTDTHFSVSENKATTAEPHTVDIKSGITRNLSVNILPGELHLVAKKNTLYINLFSNWRIFSSKLNPTIITNHILFSWVIMFFISLNCICMAMVHYEQSNDITNIVNGVNFMCIIIFTFELILKILAIRVVEYMIDFFNLFDAMLVIVGIYELFDGNSKIGILRTVRLLRAFKCFQFLPTMHRQLIIMVQTFGSSLWFLMLLLMFMFMFSVFGTNLFGDKFVIIIFC